MSRQSKVIIVGGGFGGLCAARALKSAPVEVTLIDRRNCHLFQPLLYQVATGSLSPGEIAAPLRSVLSRQENTRVLMGEVQDIDPVLKRVLLADGARVGTVGLEPTFSPSSPPPEPITKNNSRRSASLARNSVESDRPRTRAPAVQLPDNPGVLGGLWTKGFIN